MIPANGVAIGNSRPGLMLACEVGGPDIIQSLSFSPIFLGLHKGQRMLRTYSTTTPDDVIAYLFTLNKASSECTLHSLLELTVAHEAKDDPEEVLVMGITVSPHMSDEGFS